MEKISLWKDSENRIIDPALFSSVAEGLAKKLKEDHDGDRRRKNKRTQVRKFYDEVTRLSQLAKAKQTPWENILPMVHMLTAKAAYAEGRDLVSDSFGAFIRGSVEQVKEPEDLKIFSNFFEAFMGFYRLYGPRD